MIKNLNQLKRVLRPGMRLEVIGHCRPGCIGQLREVTWVNTQGFYTKTLNPPDPKLNAANAVPSFGGGRPAHGNLRTAYAVLILTANIRRRH